MNKLFWKSHQECFYVRAQENLTFKLHEFLKTIKQISSYFHSNNFIVESFIFDQDFNTRIITYITKSS